MDIYLLPDDAVREPIPIVDPSDCTKHVHVPGKGWFTWNWFNLVYRHETQPGLFLRQPDVIHIDATAVELTGVISSPS